MKELIYIQSELRSPKSQRNSFGNYNYRSCEDILEAVKPILNDQSCFLTLTDDLVAVLDRVYIVAKATLSNGTESITTTAMAREAVTKKGMDEAQITGSASSYARKYALNGLFCIDDNKDADTDEQHIQSRNSPEKKTDDKATPEQIEKLKSMSVEMETTNPKGSAFIDGKIKAGISKYDAQNLIDRGNK